MTNFFSTLATLASSFIPSKKASSVVFSVVLPVQDNEGNSLSDEIERIKNQIMGISGGISLARQSGIWKDQKTGKVYEDESILVTTICTPDQAKKLQCYSVGWCLIMRQEALLTQVYKTNAVFTVSPLKGF